MQKFSQTQKYGLPKHLVCPKQKYPACATGDRQIGQAPKAGEYKSTESTLKYSRWKIMSCEVLIKFYANEYFQRSFVWESYNYLFQINCQSLRKGMLHSILQCPCLPTRFSYIILIIHVAESYICSERGFHIYIEIIKPIR